ncbi:hypothetical protein [Curtobacterium ammoniigenes]|uniref:hypothetical protein n=1 Tax=Curtobacterium ammoniigenes TaxID=395387 RepID=UPI00082D2BD7|nr:hypothetical protein [Curtobacterium ammoniigenes]
MVDASPPVDSRRVLDRARAQERHLCPIASVGTDDSGELVLRFDQVSGTPLPEALDLFGALSTGVAVTLSLPLVDLARMLVDAGTPIGAVRLDDILIDDSGAPIVVDRMPIDGSGLRGILVGVRSVWDRVDPRVAERQHVDDAIGSALAACVAGGESDPAAHGLSRSLLQVRSVIVAAGPARPVRWEIPAARVEQPTPHGAGMRGLARVLGRIMTDGIPLGMHRRIPARRALIAAVVATGAALSFFAILPAPEEQRSPVADATQSSTGFRTPVAPASAGATADPSGTDGSDPAVGGPDREGPTADDRASAGHERDTATGFADDHVDRTDESATEAAVRLMNRRRECRTSADQRRCLATTTAPGGAQRARDAAAPTPPDALQPWTTAAVVQDMNDGADERALIRVEDISGMQTASVLIMRTEAVWLIMAEVLGPEASSVSPADQ